MEEKSKHFILTASKGTMDKFIKRLRALNNPRMNEFILALEG